MASFLRDEFLQNLTVTEDRILQIDQAMRARYERTPELLNKNDDDVFYSYIIRFDSKGYRVFSIDELLSYFNQADEVERIVFRIESEQSLASNRATGTYMELGLDTNSAQNSYMVASSDDADWVEASFSNVKEVVEKCNNRHSWIRNQWSELTIQISGVFLGFLISLWGANNISPYLDLENGFIIVFLFVLLIFSNLWTYISPRLIGLVHKAFPSIKFYRPDRDRLHWLAQAIIGAIFVAIFFFLLDLLWDYAGSILSEFIKEGT